MNRPTVTVCIATCNQRNYIEQCLCSVLEQKANAEIRILVGDDASDDGTSAIVAKLASEHSERVRCLLRKERLGAFANMRDLMTRAQGEFIARTDGDDYWLPGKLERQLAILQTHSDCAAVFTNAITVDRQGNRIGLFNDVGDGCFDIAAMLRRGNFLCNSSVVFRQGGRRAWLNVNVPQIDYRAHLWHARHGWLAHIGEPLTAYRVNAEGSLVANMNDHVRELYWEAIQSVPRDLVSDDDYAHGLADFLRRVTFRTVTARRWELMRTWVPRVMSESPFSAPYMSLLTGASILRIIGKEIAGLFARTADGKRKRVLYRR